MGLDIYTYTKAEHEPMEEYARRWDDNEDYDWEADPEKEERRALDSKISRIGETVKSEQFPDNINERRYLRSSYNDSGFNRRVPMATGNDKHDYYGILAPLREGDEYKIKVADLDAVAAARANAVEVVEQLEANKDKKVRFSYDVTVVNPFAPSLPETTEEEALALANEQLDRDNPFGGGWSSSQGLFVPDGMNVVAVIPGKNCIGSLSVHIITEETLHESYLESAKVLVEFLDELAMLVERDGEAYIHWSG